AVDVLQWHRRSLRDVIPAQDQMTARSQPAMAGGERELALLPGAQAVAEDPVTHDQIEVGRRQMRPEGLQGSGEMPPRAEFPSPRIAVESPIVLRAKIGLAVVARIPVAAHEQHRADLRRIRIMPE